MPSLSNHWYFHVNEGIRDMSKIWKSIVPVATVSAAMRILRDFWKSATFSCWRRSFKVSIKLDNAVKTHEKIAPLRSETGNKQSKTKAMEREWLCLNDNTASRMKSSTMYRKLRAWIFQMTLVSKHGRVTPQPKEATNKRMIEKVDLMTVNKMASTDQNLPRSPVWFQSFKKMNHKKLSKRPKKITAAMQFWIMNNSFHHRTDKPIQTTAKPT
mmetsp:Transcript_161624/g.513610  ORF Transcript_161624/g.513610 Transcript_161624/m.513610 type:complete len:213 (+) Transcript_161624:414-1052(+)